MSTRNTRPRMSRGALFVLAAALVALAALFLAWSQCGLGRSGDGGGDGDETAAGIDASAAPCAIRVASDGSLRVGDEAVTTDTAVRRCEAAPEAVLEAAGDAPFGAVQDLRRALEEAGVPVRERAP